MLESIVDCPCIDTFRNGKLAIDEIKSRIDTLKPIPKIIFLDINMPIMDGWQFLTEFSSLPITQSIKINIVTSSIDKTDRDRWKKIASNTHHTITFNNKPLRRENLLKITTAA
ncbi:MAG: hypothetical protein Mars2KO_40350 [Maribacter sp.]